MRYDHREKLRGGGLKNAVKKKIKKYPKTSCFLKRAMV
jgi:hypothetical protein